jgi:hypothetical protein
LKTFFYSILITCIISLVICLIFWWEAPPEPPPLKIKGSIINKRYYNPTGLFSFNMPLMLQGMEIRESRPHQQLHQVFIHDHWGNMTYIEVIVYPPEDSLKLLPVQENAEDLYKAFFHRSFLKQIRDEFPGTKVLDERCLDIEGIGKSFFAFVAIPGGSTIRDKETDERFDSQRAYYLSFKRNHAIILSMQVPLYFQAGNDNLYQFDINDSDRFYEELVELRRSYIIEKQELTEIDFKIQ